MSQGWHLFFHQPTPVFKARVNMASATYPATSLVYDGVTLGAFGDVRVNQTLILGSTDGADDLGKVRVQNLPDADSIPIGRVSRGNGEDGTLDIQDNAYITVLDEFLPWAKIPRFVLEGVGSVYKDSDVEVGDYNEDIPPISNSGPFFADYIDPITGLITVQFPLNGVNQSVAVAEGATISSYDWDVVDGTITVGSVSTSVITATFPAGQRWVALTVTDSNGTPHTSYCFVLAVDPDDDVTYPYWNNARFQMTQQGQTLELELSAPLDRTEYPDGSLVLAWKNGAVTPGSRSHMKFVGWQMEDNWSVRSSRRGFSRSSQVRCYDMAHILDFVPGFPQAVERPDVDDEINWQYMPDLDMHKMLFYLSFWHTTVHEIADVLLPENAEDYDFMRLDSLGSSIYDQLNGMARKMVPRRLLTCNPFGQLTYLTDWMEIDSGDRPASAWGIAEEDIVEISSSYNRHPQVHVLNTGAFLTTTEWLEIGGIKDLPTVFSKAPGDAFSQGTNEVTEGEGLALTQDALNVATGHRYARMNARFALFSITLASTYDWWEIAPALLLRVQLSLSAAYAAQRGLPFETAEGQVKELTISLSNQGKGVKQDTSLRWEMETEGYAGQTHEPETPTEPDDVVVPEPIDTQPVPFGSSVVAGVGQDGFIYRTSDFDASTPTWDRVDSTIADTIYSWVVDPFSPGYINQNGTGEINGWIVNDTAIYRVVDLFGTPSANAVFTFDEATSGASYHWRSIQASFGAFFSEGNNPWLVCTSYYGELSGHEGTWETHSTDGGQTWSVEQQLSANYANADTRFNPIGIYLSPKTPGLGYTVVRGQALTDGMPHWVYFDDAGVLTDQGAAATKHHEELVTDVAGGGATSQVTNLMIAPPLNAARVLFHGLWSTTRVSSGLGSANCVVDIRSTPTQVDVTEDLSVTITAGTGASGTEQGGFTCEALLDSPFSSNVWPGTIDQIGGGSGDDPSEFGVGINFNISVNDTGGASDSVHVVFDIVIDEVELEDGTIYTFGSSPSVVMKTTDWGVTWAVDTTIDPGSANAGTIHFPWEDNAGETVLYHGYFDASGGNREFKLFRVEAGVATDISPNDGSRDYGVNRGHFGVRAYDSDRQVVLAAVMGNDTSSDPDDDFHALYISLDAGDTWSEVVAPFADSSAPTNRPALEAAFSGTDPDQFFIWGPPNYIKSSSDGGASVDDKVGNIVALGGCPGFVGIAGGPIG